MPQALIRTLVHGMSVLWIVSKACFTMLPLSMAMYPRGKREMQDQWNLCLHLQRHSIPICRVGVSNIGSPESFDLISDWLEVRRHCHSQCHRRPSCISFLYNDFCVLLQMCPVYKAFTCSWQRRLSGTVTFQTGTYPGLRTLLGCLVSVVVL